MGKLFNDTDFSSWLVKERPRLLRLCGWFTGDPQEAEDLVQETLLAAWKNRDQLRSPDKVKPWLTAIARNAYLNWTRKSYREKAVLIESIDNGEDLVEGELQGEDNLEQEFDRIELARLLDQALALLPSEKSELLIDCYIKEFSHAEIAKKMGLRTGTVAVRLQRGKINLNRVLREHLQKESQAFGLLPTERALWETTNIWCPRCGQRRLFGQFKKDNPDALFALRCSHCNPDPKKIMVSFDLTHPFYASFVRRTKTYKPAYSRLITGLASLYHKALSGHQVSCLVCSRPARVNLAHEANLPNPSQQERISARIYCPNCDWATNMTLFGLVMALPDAQHFWRKNPRIRSLPTKEIEIHGVSAYVTRLQSLTSAAEMTVISRRDNLELISIHTNIPF